MEEDGLFSQVALFSGQGSSYPQVLTKHVRKRSNEDVFRFLKSSNESLREEIALIDSVSSEVPDIDFIALIEAGEMDNWHGAPFSVPLIFISQVANILEGGLSLALEHSLCTSGHSQGLAVSLVLSASVDQESFITLSCAMVKVLFWVGLHAHRQSSLSRGVSGGVPETWILSVLKVDRDCVDSTIARLNNMLAECARVSVGLINGEHAFGVVGPPLSLQMLKLMFDKLGARTSALPVAAPFHSAEINGSADDTIKLLNERGLTGEAIGLTPKRLRIPVFSCVDGSDLRDSDHDLVEYFVCSQLVYVVNWPAAVEAVRHFCIDIGSASASPVIVDYGPGEQSASLLLTQRILLECGSPLEIRSVPSSGSGSDCGMDASEGGAGVGDASGVGASAPIGDARMVGRGVAEKWAGLGPVQGREAITDVVVHAVEKVLGGRLGDRDVSLMENGMDSQRSVLFAHHLTEVLAGASAIPSTFVFSYSTVAQMVEFLWEDVSGEGVGGIRSISGSVGRRPAPGDAISIVGMAMKLPGAASPSKFWSNLCDGLDSVSEIPHERWDMDLLYSPEMGMEGKHYSRHGGFVEGLDGFDASFFGVSASEAAQMDPQQRLVLEISFSALHSAGLSLTDLAGANIGVFVGAMNTDFIMEVPSGTYAGLGTSGSLLANRVSYNLGLKGPSMTIDTACSSSLVALDVATQSLQSGRCDAAVVVGVNFLHPRSYCLFSTMRMLSPRGRCHAFDHRADGYVRGEGCGAMVLKRSSDAVADGNQVHAVVKGLAVNQDGRSASITAPNGLAQEDCVRQALASAGVEGSDISYVECHGTGTALGDPIEFGALKATLSPGRDHEMPLVVGAVKTNIGHLEGAAGIVGLIKATLVLKHGAVPPNLHLEKVNPHLVPLMDDFPVVLPQEMTRLRRRSGGGALLAGVSSFGFGGTNGHVILEESPASSALAASGMPVPAPELGGNEVMYTRQSFPWRKPSHPFLQVKVPLPASLRGTSRRRACVFDAVAGPRMRSLASKYRLNGVPMLPGGALVEAAAAACRHALSSVSGSGPGDERQHPVELRRILFEATCPLDGDVTSVPSDTRVRTSVLPGDHFEVSRVSGLGASSETQDRCLLGQFTSSASTPRPVVNLTEVRARCCDVVDLEKMYLSAEGEGVPLEIGAVKTALCAPNEVLLEVSLPSQEQWFDHGYGVHPTFLSLALLAARFCSSEGTSALDPVSVDSIQILAQPGLKEGVFVYACIEDCEDGVVTCDAYLVNRSGSSFVTFNSIVLKHSAGALVENSLCNVAPTTHALLTSPLGSTLREERPAEPLLPTADATCAPTIAEVAFLFTGQGSQYVGMGSELYATDDAFREALDRCCELFDALLPTPLLAVIMTDDEGLVNETQFSQPAVFAVEYALAEAWKASGVIPGVVMGHSVGEYAAACVAGVMLLEDAVKLIAARGRLIGGLPKLNGCMVSVRETEASVRKAMSRNTSGGAMGVAAVNGPKSVVVSGEEAAVQDVIRDLGCANRALTVSHAFHSPLMAGALEPYRAVVSTVNFSSPHADGPKFVSCVTGELVGEEVCSADYWVNHISNPVRFMDGMRRVAGLGVKVLVEVGPQEVLCKMGKQCVAARDFSWFGSLDKTSGASKLQSAVASVATLVPVQVPGLVNKPAGPEVDSSPSTGYLPLGFSGSLSATGVLGYEVALSGELSDLVKDYSLFGCSVLNGSLCIEMMCALAYAHLAPASVVTLNHLSFDGYYPILPNWLDGSVDGFPLLHCSVRENSLRFRAGVEGRVCCEANASSSPSLPLTHLNLELVRQRCSEAMPEMAKLYDTMDAAGLKVGPSFQALESVYINPEAGDLSEMLCRLTVSDASQIEGFGIHPGLLGCALALVNATSDLTSGPFVLHAVRKVMAKRTRCALGKLSLWCYLKVVEREGLYAVCDVTLVNDIGSAILCLEGAVFRIADAGRLEALEPGVTAVPSAAFQSLYETKWVQLPEEPEVERGVTNLKSVLIVGEASWLSLALKQLFDERKIRWSTASMTAAAAALTSRQWDAVIHAGALEAGAGDEDVLDSLIGLVRGLSVMEGTTPWIGAVTEGSQLGLSGELASPQHAGIWACARGLRREYHDVKLLCVDLETGMDADSPASASSLLDKLTRASERGDEETELELVLGAHTLVPRLVPCVTLGELDHTSHVSAAGTYVVTLGAEALGTSCAKWLVTRGARSIALLSVSGCPDSETSRAELAELHSADIKVVHFACNVANEKDVESVLAKVRETMPPLCGVFHTTGVCESAPVSEYSREHLDRVFGANATGGWNLHRQTRSDALELFVLCSSATAVFGMEGYVGFGAANGNLAGLAHYRRSQHLPATCILWSCEEDGVPSAVPKCREDLFDVLVGCDRAEVLAAPIDWDSDPVRDIAEAGLFTELVSRNLKQVETRPMRAVESGSGDDVLSAASISAATSKCLYEVKWVPAVTEHEVELMPSASSSSVVVGDGSLASDLATSLSSSGAACFQASLSDIVTAEGCERILAMQKWRSIIIVGTEDAGDGMDVVDGVIHLCNTLGSRQGSLDVPAVVIVTQGTQTVHKGRSVSSPKHGGVWGVCRTIREEIPSLNILSVDVPVGASRARHVLVEVEHFNAGSPDSCEVEVALGEEARYVPRLLESTSPDVSPMEDAISGDAVVPIRDEATYVISGGVGALGLKCGLWLVGKGARNLVLLSRRGVPPESGSNPEWDELEASGAVVRCMRCDIGVESDVVDVLTEVRKSMPPLAGIVHCAGVVIDAAIGNQTREHLEFVFKPKVMGALYLDKHTRGDSLDLFWLYSSVSGLLGGTGQANYAAANTCLDSLAAHRRSLGLPGVSIQWGPWADTGMASGLAQYMLSIGFIPISTEVGAGALDHVLLSNLFIFWHVLQFGAPTLAGVRSFLGCCVIWRK